MTPLAIEIIVALVTFVCSVGSAAFVSGTRWGRIEATLNDIQKDRVRQTDMRAVSERLARIEGMFTLQLKGPDNNSPLCIFSHNRLDHTSGVRCRICLPIRFARILYPWRFAVRAIACVAY